MADTVLETLSRQYEGEQEILHMITEVKEVFENHFDRTWFSLLLDDMPIESRTLREIRHLVSLRTMYPGDEWEIWQRVRDLEEFISHVKRFLLPALKEKLGISTLQPGLRVRDDTQLIIRKFIAFTFPYNLERLSVLTTKLKAGLLLHYPFLS